MSTLAVWSSGVWSSAAVSGPPLKPLKRRLLSARPTLLSQFIIARPSSSSSLRESTSSRYAASEIKEDSNSVPIYVVADVKTERIIVLGGSGFVGSAIRKAAVSKGIEVVSLSRSGRPTYSDPWVDQVTWIAGDVFYARWDDVLVGATAFVPTLGGFGSEEQMKIINREANILAVNAAKEYGVVLRPGFIYGKRKVDGYETPPQFNWRAVRLLSVIGSFTKPLSSLLGSDLLLAPPVSVDDLAYAVINAVVDDDFFGVFTIEQIKEAAAKVKKA